MADLNSINLTGRLTRDPELRTTNGGTSVCNFRIAVNGFKDGETTYLDVTAWGNRGESCAQYLHKGSRVGVQGRLGIREFEHNGERRTAVEVTANDVAFIDTKAESQALCGQAQPAQAAAPAASGGQDDDIPF